MSIRHIAALTLALTTTAFAQRTVTMYAGQYTPTAATTVSAQNPRVVTALRTLAQRFEQQTGIKVQFVDAPGISSGSGDARTAWQSYMQSNIAASTAPDIVFVPQGPDQSATGWFLPLNPYFSRPNKFVTNNRRWDALFYPKAIEKLRGVENQNFVVPYAASYPYIVIGAFYNKDLMLKAGVTKPPTSWEDWIAQLAKLKNAGVSPIVPFPAESKTGSAWPLWSMLVPAYTAYLVPKVDADKSGAISPIEIAQAVKSGVITMQDPHLQEALRQHKRQISYYLPGWNAVDVQSAWTQGKVAQKYGGFWEIYNERSNTGRKFDWGFFPVVPVTQASGPLVTWKPKLAPTGSARLEGIDGATVQFAVVKPSVERNKNTDAVMQWLAFITTPVANEFVVNENPDAVPGVRGAKPDPLWNQLTNLPVPDYGSSIYPFALDETQQTTLQRELTVWAFGRETDEVFFANVQKDMMRAAEKVIAGNR